MNILLIYIVKVAVYLLAFYLVYSSILSRDTTYARNRAFILISLVSSLIFPLIIIEPVKPLNMQFFGKFLSDVFVTASSNGSEKQNNGFNTESFLQIAYSVYIIVFSVLVFKLAIDLLNLLFLIIRHKNNGSLIIRFHGFNTAGFSAMGYIFINTRLLPEEAGEIIRHEQNHLKRNHFVDIIFIELIKAFQWFNPAVYLFNRSLRAIHEYQADQECLRSGVPVVNYQSLLLNQVFKSRAFKLTNSFSNPSLIRKRMIMMTKKRTSALASMKLLLVIPVIGTAFLAISAYTIISDKTQQQILQVNTAGQSVSELITGQQSQMTDNAKRPSEKITSSAQNLSEIAAPPPPPPPPPSEKAEDGKTAADDPGSGDLKAEPFVNVEQMPSFPGGDIELLKYIGSHTTYPENAKNKNVQGRVIIRFCVTSEGGVSRIGVVKGVDPELDAEAVRVVKSLPPFEPGRQGGIAVPVWYMVPITFTLK
jgi:TonB family protein